MNLSQWYCKSWHKRGQLVNNSVPEIVPIFPKQANYSLKLIQNGFGNFPWQQTERIMLLPKRKETTPISIIDLLVADHSHLRKSFKYKGNSRVTDTIEPANYIRNLRIH